MVGKVGRGYAHGYATIGKSGIVEVNNATWVGYTAALYQTVAYANAGIFNSAVGGIHQAIIACAKGYYGVGIGVGYGIAFGTNALPIGATALVGLQNATTKV